MPINRYSIRNVYSLADPELYKAADKDDPEALLEGVAMAGLVGLLRQLGDLAEFAAEIFHELHEEVMVTGARGHGLLVRVQQLESEIPLIEKAYLSQTSHSAFFPNSGIDWHPTRQTTQNLITTGDLPRFVMGSYEECRGPPRLFLLDKFDVGGVGACLKRYTDPSVFRVEASSYEIETAESQRDKRIRKIKKKGSKWNGGETPDVSQPSHVKLHQLFLEERVQTGALEPARRVKLKKRPNNSPFDSGSGESYMNRVINSPLDLESGESYVKKLFSSLSDDKDVQEGIVRSLPLTSPSDTSKDTRLEIPDDDNIMGSALGPPVQNKSPCVSSSLEKITYEGPTDACLKPEIQEEVDENQIAVDEEINTDGFRNGYISDDMASETDNYMDAIAPMDSELDTRINYRTYSDANEDQLQSQLSDSQSIESLTASDDENSSITKNITLSVDSDTASTSTGNTSPVGADLRPRPFVCIEIPFSPRVPPVAEKILMTEHLENDVASDKCIDVRTELDISSEADSALHVDQVAMLEEGTSSAGTDLPPQPFASIEFPFCPQVPLVTEKIPMTEHLDNDVTSDTCIDVRTELYISSEANSAPHVDPAAMVEEGTSNKTDSYEVSLNDIEVLDSPEGSEVRQGDLEVTAECTSEHSDFLPTAVDDLSSFSFVRNVKGDVDDKYPNDTSIPMIPLPNMLDSNEVQYTEENHGKHLVDILCSSPHSVTSHADTTEEHHLKEVGDGGSHRYDLAEASVLYFSENERETNNLEIEVVSCDVSDLASKEETELEEREIKPVNTVSDRNDCKDLGDDTELEGREVNIDLDMQTSVAYSSLVDVDKHEDSGCASLEDRSVINHLCILQDSKESGEHVEVDQLLVISTDLVNVVDSPSLNLEISQDHRMQDAVLHDLSSQPVDIAPCDLSNLLLLDDAPDSTVSTEVVHKVDFNSFKDNIDHPNDQIDINEAAHSFPDSTVSTKGVHNVDSLSLEDKIDLTNDQIDIFEAAQSSPGEDKVDHSNGQLYARGSCYYLTHVDHEKLSDTSSEPYQVNLTCLNVAQKVDQGKHVHSQGLQSSPESYPVPVSGNPPTTELLQGNTPDVDLSDQVKHHSAPVFSGLPILPQLDSVKRENMPPLPPMQWRMRQPPTAGGQFRDDHFPPTFSFTPSEYPQVVDPSTLDGIINLDTVNQKSQCGMGGFNLMLSAESSLLTEDHDNLSVSSEGRVTETAIELNHASRNLKISDQEVFGLQSKSYSPPPVFDNVSDNFPPAFASALNEDPHVVDETKNLDTENPKSVSKMSSSDHRIHTKDHEKPYVLSEENFSDNLVEAAAQTTSAQENVRPSSNAYSFPLDVDVMPDSIQPMKILRPRSPLIDAVAAHDKTKLRKASDRAITQTPKEEEHDTILDQIRARAFKLKPAVQTRSTSIQGPMTNLKVAAILEKANAIRQAFAGSDDDSDSWSD